MNVPEVASALRCREQKFFRESPPYLGSISGNLSYTQKKVYPLVPHHGKCITLSFRGKLANSHMLFFDNSIIATTCFMHKQNLLFRDITRTKPSVLLCVDLIMDTRLIAHFSLIFWSSSYDELVVKVSVEISSVDFPVVSSHFSTVLMVHFGKYSLWLRKTSKEQHSNLMLLGWVCCETTTQYTFYVLCLKPLFSTRLREIWSNYINEHFVQRWFNCLAYAVLSLRQNWRHIMETFKTIVLISSVQVAFHPKMLILKHFLIDQHPFLHNTTGNRDPLEIQAMNLNTLDTLAKGVVI